MSRALSPSVARCYGLARVARVWSISRASVYRALKETQPNTPPRRPGPVGACSDAELADHIRRQIAASRLHGEGYRKLWARLRFAGVRASPRRVRRVMRENGLLAPHRVGRTETKPHDGTIITDKANEMWGTDMTQTITVREGRANVFVTVEHANSEVVGIHASRSANRFEALEPVRQPVSCAHRIALAGEQETRVVHDTLQLGEHITRDEILAHHHDGIILKAMLLRLRRQCQQRGAGKHRPDRIHRSHPALITAPIFLRLASLQRKQIFVLRARLSVKGLPETWLSDAALSVIRDLPGPEPAP